jgi:hypothetical protein
MLDAFERLSRVGGVVFTNGERDPWSGGSPRAAADLSAPPGSPAGVQYVTYPGVAHCNDFYWMDPFEAPGRRELRAYAMASAAAAADAWRASRLWR